MPITVAGTTVTVMPGGTMVRVSCITGTVARFGYDLLASVMAGPRVVHHWGTASAAAVASRGAHGDALGHTGAF